MANTKEYHFNCGNSSKGTVGFCARVLAKSKKEAVALLQAAMPEEYETSLHENEPGVVYFNFYLNSAAVKVRHIDDFHDVQTCDDCGDELPDGAVGCPDGAEICQDCFDAGGH